MIKLLLGLFLAVPSVCGAQAFSGQDPAAAALSTAFTTAVSVSLSTKTSLYVGPGISSPTIENGQVVFSSVVSPAAGATYRIWSWDPVNTGPIMTAFLPAASGSPGINELVRSASGTPTAPLPTPGNQYIYGFSPQAMDVNGTWRNLARFRYKTDTSTGVGSATAIPGHIQIFTTNSLGSESERCRFTSSGTFTCGESSESPVATRLGLTDTSGSSPVFKMNGANSSVFQMNNVGDLTLSGRHLNLESDSRLSISSAALFGIAFSTQAGAGAGNATTALCPSGKYAISGGCSCSGGVAITGYIDFEGTAFPAAGAGIKDRQTCQQPGGTGGDCAAWVKCGYIQ